MTLLIDDTHMTAQHQPGRLRREFTSQEIKKDVAICSKPGNSTGPNRCLNDLTKTITDEDFKIVKMCSNEMLTEDTVQQRATMNGTILQLHKGGGTNEISDQLPVVCLNSVYQQLNYVINDQYYKIVKPANMLKPEQGGGRQKRCVSTEMQRVHFIRQEARRQGKKVY